MAKAGKIILMVFVHVFVFCVLGIVLYYFLNQQTIEYRPISGPMTNPLMGIAPWATIEESTQPHTLVYADLTWREFEPREGIYDFTSFEKQNQLARWRSEGKRVVFRFLLDYPGSKEHMDIPDWLYDKIGGDGDFYDHDYGKGFSPNYSNPVLIEYHQNAIQALGERYGGDDFFAYIELGSLGHWGEWHVKYDAGIRNMPSEEIRDLYVSHYIEAFPNTHLLMRRPFSIAAKLGLGVYNDMTADFEATTTWLDWIANGGEYNQTQEANALSAMPNGWQIAPIGGEQTGSMSPEEIYDIQLEQTIRLLEDSHTTFIGPGGPYDLVYGGSLQQGINQVLATIGYRLYVQQVKMPRWVHFGEDIEISLAFANAGIAPFYYDWPVRIYVIDEVGERLADYRLDLDLRTVLPDTLQVIAFTVPVEKLDNGRYSIAIAIIDPLTDEPAVQLAMFCACPCLIQQIGSFEIYRVKDRLENLISW
ncbi:MAG: DUF4832 domain-containing protein [Chloroflexi bacterium]|nr:DUF4832 domain-containing protein [Chloroflexota bacterium]